MWFLQYHIYGGLFFFLQRCLSFLLYFFLIISVLQGRDSSRRTKAHFLFFVSCFASKFCFTLFMFLFAFDLCCIVSGVAAAAQRLCFGLSVLADDVTLEEAGVEEVCCFIILY